MTNLDKLDSIIARAQLWRRHNQADVLTYAAMDLIEALANEMREIVMSLNPQEVAS